MSKIIELVRCRLRCRLCNDVIESHGWMVKCSCGAVGIDGKPGNPNQPRRLVGQTGQFVSMCEWRHVTGYIIRGEGSSVNFHYSHLEEGA
ncbi:DUF7695 domain-containing protein [Hahella ganghwensis]|uniref:DUF7695 domain-containing protein n=1 Tax=Hahella ganghwensis TaxID=286420 RepID=UPI003CCBA5EE